MKYFNKNIFVLLFSIVCVSVAQQIDTTVSTNGSGLNDWQEKLLFLAMIFFGLLSFVPWIMVHFYKKKINSTIEAEKKS